MSCFEDPKLLICHACKQHFNLLEEHFPGDLFSLLLQNDIPQIHWLCKSCNVSRGTSNDIEKLNSRVSKLETNVLDIQRSLSKKGNDIDARQFPYQQLQPKPKKKRPMIYPYTARDLFGVACVNFINEELIPTQQLPQQKPQPKRIRTKALQLINPLTGRNIFDRVGAENCSGTASEKEKLIPTQQLPQQKPQPKRIRTKALQLINPLTGRNIFDRVGAENCSGTASEKEKQIPSQELPHQQPQPKQQGIKPLHIVNPLIGRNMLEEVDAESSSGPASEKEKPHPAVNNQGSQQGVDEKSTIIMSFTGSITQNIRLHKSDNPWKPLNKLSLADMTQEDLDREKLKGSVQGVLNKLTLQKFETLLVQLKGLNIDTKEKLNLVIDLIFEKAICEPKFVAAYANLCKHLSLIKVPLAYGGQVNFRTLLLTKCQKGFEDTCDELKHVYRIKASKEGELDKQNKIKLEFHLEGNKIINRKLGGNIRFVGELFRLGMLIEPVIHECIKKLLRLGVETSLECLSELLKRIGKELDKTKGGKSRDHSPMDMYLARIQKYVDKRLTSSRVRFMLQDVIDLKNNSWVPRKDDNIPQTIDKIRQKSELEQQSNLQNIISNYPFVMPDGRVQRKPSGLLQKILDMLCDEDVIKEEAFKAWEFSPDKSENKEVALQSVLSFFKYLRETELEEVTDEQQ